ncbi:MAG: hypothetical protein U9Q74_12420 [Gemmatimonadota bacterium]|nr:hypothetical protein [Gemmatimonadota bacterium]
MAHIARFAILAASTAALVPAREAAAQGNVFPRASVVVNQSGRAGCETTLKAVAGINRVQWTLVVPMLNAPAGGGGRGGGAAGGGGAAPDVSCSGGSGGGGGGGGRGGVGSAADPGAYVVRLSIGGKEYTKTVLVLDDRWMDDR